MSTEFHQPILSIFCGGFMHFCSICFLFQPDLTHNFPDILHAFPHYQDYDINIIAYDCDINGHQIHPLLLSVTLFTYFSLCEISHR